MRLPALESLSFAQWTVALLLALGVGSALSLSAATYSVIDAGRELREARTQRTAADQALHAALLLSRVEADLYDYVHSGQPAERETLDQHRRTLSEALAALEAEVGTAEAQKLKWMDAAVEDGVEEVLSASSADEGAKAAQLLSRLHRMTAERVDLMETMAASLGDTAGQAAPAESAPPTPWALAPLWAPLLIGAVVSGSLAIRYTRRFNRQLGWLRGSLVRLSQGKPSREQAAPALLRPLRGLAQETQHLGTVLNEADSLRLQFIAMVSHEMRAPIASVLGFSTMLLESGTGLAPEQLRFIEIIHRQSNKLAKLVDDLLVAGRLDANQLDYAFSPVRVKRLLQEVVQDLGRSYPGRSVDVVSDSRLDTIDADALRLKQVFANLIQNALKFSPNDQPVSVRLRDSEDGGHLIVDVVDRGIGMSTEEQKTLFQRFGRIRNDRTRSIPGSGLGLYISQRIVLAHGGQIEVESESGQGSRFSVYLQAVTGRPEGVQS